MLQPADPVLDVPDLVNDLLHHVWQRGDTARIGDFYTEDATIAGVIPDVVLSRAELANALDHLLMLVRITEYELCHLVEDGQGNVAYQVTFCIEHLMTGKSGKISGSIFAQIRAGKVAGSVSVMDYLSLLEHYELVPRGTLLICLSGQSLT